MTLLESGEMYLETILILSRERERVRSIDISEYMGFSKPSVSRAMGLLREGGYIEGDEFGHIHLTEAGREVAERIYDRHNTLTEVLLRLGVDKGVAAADACRMEHYISEASFQAIKKHLADHTEE